MLNVWGRVLVARRRLIVAAALLVAVLAAGWGPGVFDRLVTGGFEDPGSESARAGAQITATFGGQTPDVLAVYSSAATTVDDPSFRAPVEAAAGRLRALPAVAGVTSYYDGAPGLVSRDRHATYLVIRLRALDDSGKRAGYDAIRPLLRAPGLTTQIGGTVAVAQSFDDQTKTDVTRGEMVALPLVLVLLILIFGGVVAATMPILIGILSIVGALSVTRVITLFTDVSTFAVNTITLLGLGMAVDYSLLVINRFREELGNGQPAGSAVLRTMASAGRTVLVSGLLVTLSLASLLIFPEVFLRSMALGGMAAVLVAMLSALTVLPAILALLGTRINALRVRLPRRARRRAGGPVAPSPHMAGSGVWARLAGSVMRRPVPYVAVVLAVLATLALPLSHVRFGSVDERALPVGNPARTATERVASDFADAAPAPILVLVEHADAAGVDDLQRRMRNLPDVTGTQLVVRHGTDTLLAARYPGSFAGSQALDAVRQLRTLNAPAGARILVGGESAATLDEMDSLGARLPLMLAIMALVTLGVLLVAFGSALLPVKAVLTNVVSIAATFGALVWIFQDGHLAGLLGFTPTGNLEPTVLILVLAELFGLATDYEVFLLSRVREQWEATGDNTTAVATGLQRTGRIITAAAALLIVVTAGFATGQIVVTKLIGIGMVVGILLDATLIRALLVPATMRLLGRWNWWAPPGLARRRRRGAHVAPAGAEPDRHPVLID